VRVVDDLAHVPSDRAGGRVVPRRLRGVGRRDALRRSKNRSRQPRAPAADSGRTMAVCAAFAVGRIPRPVSLVTLLPLFLPRKAFLRNYRVSVVPEDLILR
jgi:hypothetical protein